MHLKNYIQNIVLIKICDKYVEKYRKTKFYFNKPRIPNLIEPHTQLLFQFKSQRAFRMLCL